MTLPVLIGMGGYGILSQGCVFPVTPEFLGGGFLLYFQCFIIFINIHSLFVLQTSD